MRSHCFLWSLPALLPLFACVPVPVPGGCEGASPPRAVSGCLVPAGGWGDVDPIASGDGADVQVSGTVVESDVGEPPDQCFTAGGPVGVAPEAGGVASWVELEDEDGVRWFVAIHGEGVTPSFEVGDVLDVAFSFRFGGFSPDVGRLEIRDEEGILVGWVAEAGSLGGIEVPSELERVEAGPAACAQRDSCGDWQALALDVTVLGTDASVGYGRSQDVAGLSVLHGGFEQQVGEAQGCPDWFVAHVAIGLFPAQ